MNKQDLTDKKKDQVKTNEQKDQVQADEQRNHVQLQELLAKLGYDQDASIRIVEQGHKIEVFPNIHNLTKLYIEPTSRCNLNCRTCIRETWNEPLGTMDIKVFDKLFEQMKEIKTLKSVMFGGFGEPTFHRDILYMIGKIKSLGVKVEMVTNGTLLNDTIIQGLIEKGLDTLWVSFDGTSTSNFDDIRAGASFKAVFQNVKRLRNLNQSGHRIKIGIAFVVMKSNIHELKNLPDLARSIDAEMVSVSNVIPYNEEMLEQMVCQSKVVDKLPLNFYMMDAAISIPLIDLTERSKQPLYDLFRSNNKISQMRNKMYDDNYSCRFIQERCSFIRWDGVVSPCMGLLHSYKTYFIAGGIEREVTHYGLGDINKQSLKEIWDSKEYHDFREKVDAFEFSPCHQCGPCELAESNQKDCFGNEFPTCGGCLWAQGVIQCP